MKVIFRRSVPSFAWREREREREREWKTISEKIPLVHPTKILTSISPSSAVESTERVGAFDHEVYRRERAPTAHSLFSTGPVQTIASTISQLPLLPPSDWQGSATCAQWTARVVDQPLLHSIRSTKEKGGGTGHRSQSNKLYHISANSLSVAHLVLWWQEVNVLVLVATSA
uniref:Uncharacterized protein n=1 Tax=Timema bartmani TaxID=61472 RepID=A0A7R9F7D4_9NEOP|nr:unnamed protein product [Timema bartmani]